MVFVTVKFVCGRVTVLENKSLFGFVHSWAWCYKLSGYEPTLPLPTSVGCVGKLSFLFLIFCAPVEDATYRVLSPLTVRRLETGVF